MSHFPLKHLLRSHLIRENSRYCSQFCLVSEWTSIDTELRIKQIFRVMLQCLEESGPRHGLLWRDGGRNYLLGEIAASFPISQKLDGGNRISEVVWMMETKELAKWGLESMLSVKPNLRQDLGGLGTMIQCLNVVRNTNTKNVQRVMRVMCKWNTALGILCHPQETLPSQFLNYSIAITLKATTTVVFKDAWKLVCIPTFSKRRGAIIFFLSLSHSAFHWKLMNIYCWSSDCREKYQ